ncbi:dUTPase [Curvibacter phage PCA1]|nr:dUTPase [Curvibacter phage PCA1]
MTKTTKAPVVAAVAAAAIATSNTAPLPEVKPTPDAPLQTPVDAINAAIAGAGAAPTQPDVKSAQVADFDSLFEPSKLKVKLLSDAAQMPVYASTGAACFDLHASDSVGVVGGHSVEVGTGLAFEVPVDHVMLVFSRSGHGFKNGVRLANSVGVIDSDYRGEVKIKLHNDGQNDFVVELGARVAQAMVLPIARMPLVQVEELSETDRGEAGIGSTGQ